MPNIFQPNLSDTFQIANVSGSPITMSIQDIYDGTTGMNGMVLLDSGSGSYLLLPLSFAQSQYFYMGDEYLSTYPDVLTAYWNDGIADFGFTATMFACNGGSTSWVSQLSTYLSPYNKTIDDNTIPVYAVGGSNITNTVIHINNGSTPIINGQMPVQYQWQSVPSISGKNGILSLVTLDSESINDGEPVSGASVSVFDQAPSNDNNIKNLADTYGGGEESSAVDVTVKYKVTLPPGGIFDVLKLVAKKGSEPEDVTDGDKIVNISANKTKKTVTGLDENSMYYFKIFAEDSNGSTSESNEKHITTSGDEGWSFDYTGQIQTFTAPKTGIYSLETWGAQGGDATDGTNTARGGYGAYAYGEVLLQQGETIYINVGGQNGYGGGGNYVPTEKTRVLYNNGQYDSRYFGNNVTLDTSVISGSGGFTSCTCTFESDYIGIYGAATSYWTERLATFLFDDAIIPENTIKIKVSGEYSFSNSYYCATWFGLYDSSDTGNKLFNVNSDSPTPWTNVEFETEIEKDFDKLKFRFRHDNNGSLSIKIKKIEITYLE